MGIKSFLGSIWGFISKKVVNASSAVVGTAKGVKERVDSVAGKAKNIILKRDEELQGVIDDCVSALGRVTSPGGIGVKADDIDRFNWVNSVLGAFWVMIGNEKFKEFIGDHSGEKKGFAGFANFLEGQLGGVRELKKSDIGETLDGVKTKVLRVLSRVKKYSGVGSRVNAFVDPCKKLYREIINIGTGQTDRGFDSYFDEACEHLRSAAAKKSNEKKGFRESMCDAYDAVCKMCKYEKLGKKSKGDEEEATASGKWYSECNGKTTYNEKIGAVLDICGDKYKSERGFTKRYLKFKGQTKWQKLQGLVEKAKKNGMGIGVLNDDGKLVVKQYSGGSSVFTNTHSENFVTPTSTSSNVFPADGNSGSFSLLDSNQGEGE